MNDFNKFMSQLQETNQTLDFFCDFNKIAANVDNYGHEIEMYTVEQGEKRDKRQ